MIGFATPWLLAGLALVAVPIVLHLVPRRDPPERAFPAMQYLEDATRRAPHRLHLRHLLLLASRVLLVVALVLAAAGLTWRGPVPWGGHAPIALAVIVDNSASSAAVQDGAPVLTVLRDAAREVLGAATPADRTWLMLADGVARAGTPAMLAAQLDSLAPRPERLALGSAIARARDLATASGRRAVVVVLTDAQQSAIDDTREADGVIVARVAAPAPRNAGIITLAPLDQPWSSSGGRVATDIVASDTQAVPLQLTLAGRGVVREALARPGSAALLSLPAPVAGWQVLHAELAADEFRLDDRREAAVRVAPPPGVAWTPGTRWLDAAFAVLVAEGRVRTGQEVAFDAIGRAGSIVLPPEDAARVGALNRALLSRGVAVQFGPRLATPVVTDSGALLPGEIAVTMRHALQLPPEGVEVLATAGGQPWIVRDGTTVIVASRVEPEWTALPVSAAFVPLLDVLVRRASGTAGALPDAVIGTPMTLPPLATAVVGPTGRVGLERGAPWVPRAIGVHWVLAGTDTIAGLAVTLDPRESDLARADARTLATRLPGAEVVTTAEAVAAMRSAAGGGDLRPLLLALAALCLLLEAWLAAPRGGVR
ncbi:MAG TPA: BatA and WFA domain-containing protein [Gemmatimonadales bacterium]|nr:BatA and WFA domain-containing protein [Gemmatimonadales bacterium]